MKLIESKTLGSFQASVEFTSIPGTFTDLVVLLSARTESNDGVSWFDIATEFNGSSSNLSDRVLYGTGSGVASIVDSTKIIIRVSSNLATSNTFGNASLYIPNYTASTNKSVSIDSVTENNSTAALQTITAGLWANTASITSIKFTPTSGNLSAGCLFSLYGITKGSDGIVTTSP
jgi:hypothetical protein